MAVERRIPKTTPRDMRQARAWLTPILSDPERVPISFLYAGQRISGIPTAWKPSREDRRIDATIIQTVYTGSDIQTGLQIRVEVLQYLDYPVVEWTAWLTNTGSAPTPIISDLLALDGAFAGRIAGSLSLQRRFCLSGGVHTTGDSAPRR